jgi:hypothetical protein
VEVKSLEALTQQHAGVSNNNKNNINNKERQLIGL